MDAEFQETCIGPGRIRPIPSEVDRRRAAEDFRKLSDLHLRGAHRLVDSDAAQLSIGDAYLAMENKTNQLLALEGWHSKNHICTQIAMSRILGQRDLARRLSVAYADRQLNEYTADPGTLRAAPSYAGFHPLR